MCVSIKAPVPPQMPDAAPPRPPMNKKNQGSAMTAGYSEGKGTTASSYDRKRTSASNLRIPIIGGV